MTPELLIRLNSIAIHRTPAMRVAERAKISESVMAMLVFVIPHLLCC
jgi:hypothetical protein